MSITFIYIYCNVMQDFCRKSNEYEMDQLVQMIRDIIVTNIKIILIF